MHATYTPPPSRTHCRHRKTRLPSRPNPRPPSHPPSRLPSNPANFTVKTLQRGRFTERDAVRVLRRVLAGVAYLHARGVVHRDLKCVLSPCFLLCVVCVPFMRCCCRFVATPRIFATSCGSATSCGFAASRFVAAVVWFRGTRDPAVYSVVEILADTYMQAGEHPLPHAGRGQRHRDCGFRHVRPSLPSSPFMS